MHGLLWSPTPRFCLDAEVFPLDGHEMSRLGSMLFSVVLFAATAYVLVNLVVDLSYATLDPRIRYR